ncbi:DNA-binding response regulator [Erysipelotrichaceae bacterium AF15-26LB]|nr:response regulator receiver domain protein [Erysipelotrichaceae bacterium 3_1_53]MCR0350512.1 LytTR family DNA-binding domain-containing protein [[Clostridium] innocuum]RJV91805.1 DNA-binding response regulator [Erysipelotrichaceae bacterium AF15-26LB]RJV91989.1 DNA-binding response regulator [Erysipelotrichaceae bacterium AF19-24AC]
MILHVAVCEDDRLDAAQLHRAIHKAEQKLSFECRLTFYTTGEAFLHSLRLKTPCDLVIMDIYLKAENGIDIIQQARILQENLEIAFFTTSKEYAPEAFQLNALHYIVKPLNELQIQEVFSRYFERARLPIHTLRLETERNTCEFPIHRIKKIESRNKGIEIYLSTIEEPVFINMPFLRVENIIKEEQLITVSRGLILNLSFIRQIQRNGTCQLKDGTTILISRRRRNAVLQKYHDYLFQQSETGKAVCR